MIPFLIRVSCKTSVLSLLLPSLCSLAFWGVRQSEVGFQAPTLINPSRNATPVIYTLLTSMFSFEELVL